MAEPPDAQDANEIEEKFKAFRATVLNETLAPELLPFKGDLVDFFKQSIKDRDDMLEDIEPADQEFSDFYQSDVERIRYYMQLYLRARLAKIDKYFLYYLKHEVEPPRLSPVETEYATRYRDIISDHFNTAFLRSLPEPIRGVDDEKADVDMVPKPDLDTYVFCRAKEDIGTLEVDADTEAEVEMEQGNVFIIPYRVVANYVYSGAVDLL